MPQITAVQSTADIDTVRVLLREYQQGLGIDLCFQGFESELRGLPGSYAPPHGRLYLARHETDAIGCVALQRVDATRAEMKRLYVRPQGRGLGIASALVARILDDARTIGYGEIVLDTLPSMIEAQRLYQQLGFLDIAAYRPNPIGGTRYLGKKL
jgi:putative acetyltransferase